jgi:hypothetical protein
MIKEEMEKQIKYQETIQKIQMLQGPQDVQSKINNLTQMVHELTLENTNLKDKVKYLEEKIKQVINEQIKNKLKTN